MQLNDLREEIMPEIKSGRALRPSEAAAKLGIGLSTLWYKVKNESDFVRPFKLSPRVTLFYESEIDDHLSKCAERSRGTLPS